MKTSWSNEKLSGWLLLAVLSLTAGCISQPQIDDGASSDSKEDSLTGNRQAGEACSFDIQCDEDRGLICRGYYCAKPGELDDYCIEDDDCESGNCVAAGCEPAPPAVVQVGGECDSDGVVCAEGLYCALEDQAPAGQTYPRWLCAPRQRAGAACGNDGECRGVCDAPGDSGQICIEISPSVPHEYDTCTLFDDTSCPANLVCRPMWSHLWSRCVRPGVEGSLCAWDSHCLPGLTCSPDRECR